jgi:hypothetical protein
LIGSSSNDEKRTKLIRVPPDDAWKRFCDFVMMIDSRRASDVSKKGKMNYFFLPNFEYVYMSSIEEKLHKAF